MTLPRALIDQMEALFVERYSNAEIASQLKVNVKTVREYRARWQVDQRAAADGIPLGPRRVGPLSLQQHALRWQHRTELLELVESCRDSELLGVQRMADEIEFMRPAIEAAPLEEASRTVEGYHVRLQVLGLDTEAWQRVTSATLAADALQCLAEDWKVPLSLVQAVATDAQAWDEYSKYRSDKIAAEKTLAGIHKGIQNWRRSYAKAFQRYRGAKRRTEAEERRYEEFRGKADAEQMRHAALRYRSVDEPQAPS